MMSTFIQLHFLTSYPPANLNRDDLGRPKTARMGGVDRLRVSSQSLKRTWRTSELFEEVLGEYIGKRTKRLGKEIHQTFLKANIDTKQAEEWANKIAEKFGKLKKEGLELEQLAHIGPEEEDAVNELVKLLITEKRPPKKEELLLLRTKQKAVDIALFGRMLASAPEYNIEAACQVAHAISVEPVMIEQDYFTAVDDLNSSEQDRGAAHIGETGFAAAVFYNYICINYDLLVENLNDDKTLANKAISALVEVALKVSPKGKQNSFASRAYASYALAEKGEQQPRSLVVSFLKPLYGEDIAQNAIYQLNEQLERFDHVYGPCADSRCILDATKGEGSLKELLTFLSKD